MTTQPEPTPQEEDASPERRAEEDAMRYPAHEDPDGAREDVGLDEPRESRPGGGPSP